jgi:hypothetical protein
MARVRKSLVAAQALLLLLPVTLLFVFIVFSDYPAYPQRHFSAPQAAFDLGLLLAMAGVAAAWRLVVPYLRRGRAGLREVHAAWLVLLVLGSLPGVAGAVVAGARFLDSAEPGVTVGFTLLAPAVVLLPLAVQLGREKLRTSTAG